MDDSPAYFKKYTQFLFMYIGRTKFLHDQKKKIKKEKSAYLNEQVLLIISSFFCLAKKEKGLKVKSLDNLGV